jgi:hypothetical protein
LTFVDGVTALRDEKVERRESVRRISRETVARVLATTKGQREIDVDLALGAACPFFSQWECDIWIDEIHQQLEGAHA